MSTETFSYNISSGAGTGDGQLQFLGYSCVYKGVLYVADSYNHRIAKFDPTKSGGDGWLGSFAVPTYSGNVETPYAISIYNDVIYVTVNGNHALGGLLGVYVFDLSGNLTSSWGDYGTGAGQFVSPQGIYAYSSSAHGLELFISDLSNNTVQVFSPTGTYSRTAGGPGAGLGQLNTPNAVFVYNDLIYVTDYNGTNPGRINVYNLDGTYNTTFGDTTASYPTGIWIDAPNNDIFVSSNGTWKLEVYSLVDYSHKRTAASSSGEQVRSPWGVQKVGTQIYVGVTDDFINVYTGLPDNAIFKKIDIGSLWKTVTDSKICISNAWKSLSKIQVIVGGVWKNTV
jgi:hypothetical protein